MTRQLLIGLATLGLLACGTTTTTSSSPAAPDKPTQAPAPAATAAPPAAKQVLLDASGSGANKTKVFQAAGDWDLAWSAKGNGYLGVTIYDASSNALSGLAVNTPISGEKQEVDHEHKGGKFYLDVNAANVDWHITVTG